jgi:chromate transporter
MNIQVYISFLKDVLLHSITSFGGPQANLGLLQSRFVQKRKDLTDETLLEYNALCQLLPGASSTQNIVLIGFKKGGYLLAFLTLLVWAFPACTLMTVIAILYDRQNFSAGFLILTYLKPMSIAFILSATLLLYKKAVNNVITRWIFIGASVLVLFGFKSPWTIPLVIILAGVATNFSKKRIPTVSTPQVKIKTRALFVFLFLFLVAGFLSEKATRNNWSHQKIFNVFETNYRFGTFVFGGGDVLIPLMYEQYVTRPSSERMIKSKRDVIKISSDAFFTGAGIVRAVPGPVWSVASYMGAIAVNDKSIFWQIVGAITAALGVFLPSFFIVLFALPLWQNLQKYVIVLRSLEGIHAAVVGIMLGASFYLSKDLLQSMDIITWPTVTINLIILVGCTYLLYSKKIATHWLVLSVVALGMISFLW